jgi:hypothetical protein
LKIFLLYPMIFFQINFRTFICICIVVTYQIKIKQKPFSKEIFQYLILLSITWIMYCTKKIVLNLIRDETFISFTSYLTQIFVHFNIFLVIHNIYIYKFSNTSLNILTLIKFIIKLFNDIIEWKFVAKFFT